MIVLKIFCFENDINQIWGLTLQPSQFTFNQMGNYVCLIISGHLEDRKESEDVPKSDRQGALLNIPDTLASYQVKFDGPYKSNTSFEWTLNQNKIAFCLFSNFYITII